MISNEYRKQLIQDVGDSAALLYQHFFDNQFVISPDNEISELLGWNIRKVQRERLKLCRGQYLSK